MHFTDSVLVQYVPAHSVLTPMDVCPGLLIPDKLHRHNEECTH